MAIEIQLRNSTAATWTSTNPTLSKGEPGVETDTGQFKIGDGTTAWTSLAYNGATGPAQVLPYRSLGDGSDGNVTISSGTTTLTRDMFYNNLTINGTGQLNNGNYKIFVKGILDLTAAGVAAINNNGNNGTTGTNGVSGGAGATAPTAAASGTLAGLCQAGNGGNGSANNGSNGTGAAALTGNGGGQNGSGTGGAGGTGTAGNAGGSTSPTVLLTQRFETNFFRGVSLLGGGGSAGGGGGGGGDGTFVGGGGGSGGTGGGALIIYANEIVKSSITPASCIQSIGGNGGTGGNGDPGGSTGGGGGGGSGSGGWISIYYNNLFGPVIPGMLDASSGFGGAGGLGYNGGISGKAGNAANAGTISLYQIPTGIGAKWIANEFFAANTWDPQLAAGLSVNNSQAAGGLAQLWKIAF